MVTNSGIFSPQWLHARICSIKLFLIYFETGSRQDRQRRHVKHLVTWWITRLTQNLVAIVPSSPPRKRSIPSHYCRATMSPPRRRLTTQCLASLSNSHSFHREYRWRRSCHHEFGTCTDPPTALHIPPLKVQATAVVSGFDPRHCYSTVALRYGPAVQWLTILGVIHYVMVV